MQLAEFLDQFQDVTTRTSRLNGWISEEGLCPGVTFRLAMQQCERRTQDPYTRRAALELVRRHVGGRALR